MSRNAVLWSQPNCSYCIMAARLLWANDYQVVEKKIGVNVTKEDFIKEHGEDIRRLPQIWINGVRIEGGYSGLEILLR